MRAIREAPFRSWFEWPDGAVSEPRRRRVPQLYAGARRAQFWWLMANGAAQFAVAVSCAIAVTAMGAETEPGAAVITVLAALAGVQIALRAFELGQAERFGQSFVHETRIALMKSAIRARRTQNHGIAMTRLVNDLTSLKNWVALGVARSIIATLSLAGCLVAATAIDTRLALALALPIAVVLGVVACLANPIARRTRDARRERGRLASLVGEVMLGREAYVDRVEERAILRRVSKRAKRMAAALVLRMRIVGLLRAAPEAVAPLIILGFVAARTDLSGSSALGAFLLAMLVGAPLRSLARAVEYRTSYVEARRKIEEALNMPRRRLPTLLA